MSILCLWAWSNIELLPIKLHSHYGTFTEFIDRIRSRLRSMFSVMGNRCTIYVEWFISYRNNCMRHLILYLLIDHFRGVESYYCSVSVLCYRTSYWFKLLIILLILALPVDLNWFCSEAEIDIIKTLIKSTILHRPMQIYGIYFR